MSTVEVGNDFRDEIAELLRASGHSVETEILIGHKRVDLTFEESSFGHRRRYAVEAKNWADPLSKTALEAIYGGYAALLNSGDADEILIVSPRPLQSPAAKAFIRDTPHVAHLSFNEFQESLLGFRNYLQTYVAKHDRDGLEEYYIAPTVEGQIDLLDSVYRWLDEDNSHPLAIIASYGMGKTSFAEHLTYHLAKKFLHGIVCRVPILVRLGMISREQSIEGLIGSVLAGANPSVARYSYPIFARLNAIGRFVVLLDGFDEMKHMMTYAEFIANFDELNKLVDGASKVILLGRPTAFLSENERISVLRGTRPIGRTRVRAPGAPTYREINLQPFTPMQLRSFVGAYLERSQRVTGHAISDELLTKRRDEIADPRNEELLSRPIHARMMGDLATDPAFDMANLSRFALYDHFVDELIRRELAKPGRGRLYKANDRRTFAADLAWHLWTEPASTGLGCRVDDLPDHLFEPYVPAGEELNSVKRDLLSGSFLEEKTGGVFFFSHKSFQEFLVAEFIGNKIGEGRPSNPNDTRHVVDHITVEVFDFLIEQNDAGFFRGLMSALTACEIGFSLDSALTLCGSATMYQMAMRRSSSSFSYWDAVILLGKTICDLSAEMKSDLVRVAKIVSEKGERKPRLLLIGINTLVVFGIERRIPIADLVMPIIILLFARADLDLRELSVTTEQRGRSDPLRDIVFAVISARWASGRRSLLMNLDFEELIRAISEQTSYPANVMDVEPNGLAPYREAVDLPFDEFVSELPAAGRMTMRQFYERDAGVAATIGE